MAARKFLTYAAAIVSIVAFVAALSNSDQLSGSKDGKFNPDTLQLSKDSIKVIQKLTNCSGVPANLVQQANLTESDRNGILPHICWHEDDQAKHQNPMQATRKGIPPGVDCKATNW